MTKAQQAIADSKSTNVSANDSDTKHSDGPLRAESNEPGKKGSRSNSRRSTGPRTPQGKARSKYNALKHGCYFKVLVLENESASEYKSLLDGVREERQPQGTQETEDTEYLASLLWRRRHHLKAEANEIRAEFNVDYFDSLKLEMEDLLRTAETSGGMLRHSNNPFVIDTAITMLRLLRTNLEQQGFRKNDHWILRKLYGFDSEGRPPFGISLFYLVEETIALKDIKQNTDECKKNALEYIDNELERLKAELIHSWATALRQADYKIGAAVVPHSEASERRLRRESQLNREIERTIARLERHQRRRLGQSMPPSKKFEAA